MMGGGDAKVVDAKLPWEIRVPGVYDSTKPATSWETLPQKYKPHWSVWKVEGSCLEKSQALLAKKGLSDPWARNEVWRYHLSKNSRSPSRVFFRGFGGGLLLFGGAMLIHTLYGEKIVNSR